MGIKDFYSAIEEMCGNIIQTIRLEDLCGYRVAVDVSIFLYKTIRSAGPARWKASFLLFLRLLKLCGIIPVLIHDGQNPPPEKKLEQARRRAENEKVIAKLKLARKLHAKVRDEYVPYKKQLEEELQHEVKAVIQKKRKVIDVTRYNDPFDVAAALAEAIEKYEIQTMPITDEHKRTAKEMIEIMGFAQFQAEGEAEALCAYLAVLGKVDAVMSEDTDTLAYGTPMLLSKIDLSNNTVAVVYMADILSMSGLNHDELRDLCILLSCDYNDRAKGYPPDGKKRKKPVGIGEKGAIAMIQEYRRLEECEKYIVDPDVLNYRRCRELFTVPPFFEPPVIPSSKPIDKDRLADFLIKHKVPIKVERLLDAWKPTPVTFGEVTVEEDNYEEIDLGDEAVIDNTVEEPEVEVVEETTIESLAERLDRAWSTEEWVFEAAGDDVQSVQCAVELCPYNLDDADLSYYQGSYTLSGTSVSVCHLCFEESGAYGSEDVAKAIEENYEAAV